MINIEIIGPGNDPDNLMGACEKQLINILKSCKDCFVSILPMSKTTETLLGKIEPYLKINYEIQDMTSGYLYRVVEKMVHDGIKMRHIYQRLQYSQQKPNLVGLKTAIENGLL
jgi:hypothetical protein